jgi:RNase P subunit RPR2
MARGGLPTKWRLSGCPRCGKVDGTGAERRGDLSYEADTNEWTCLQCGHVEQARRR